MNTKPAHKNANVYAVVGSDESAVKAAAAELATRLAPVDAGDFGVETIDACADNADQAAARIRSAIEALQTLPFFGGAQTGLAEKRELSQLTTNSAGPQRYRKRSKP